MCPSFRPFIDAAALPHFRTQGPEAGPSHRIRKKPPASLNALDPTEGFLQRGRKSQNFHQVG